MLLTIVIVILVQAVYCTGVELLFVTGTGYWYDGPYTSTGTGGDGKPHYQQTRKAGTKIEFQDEEWVITYDGYTRYTNHHNTTHPPESGWREYDGSAVPDMSIHLYQAVTPPTTILVHPSQAIPGIGGHYTLASYTFNGFPVFTSSGQDQFIFVRSFNYIFDDDAFYWVFADRVSDDEGSQISTIYPPTMMPSQKWELEGWSITRENYTMNMDAPVYPHWSTSNVFLFCKPGQGNRILTFEHGDDRLCDKTEDCASGADERGCLGTEGEVSPTYPYWHQERLYCLARAGGGVSSISKEDDKWCDRNLDCYNATDEENCSYLSNKRFIFSCLSKQGDRILTLEHGDKLLCNREEDCGSGDDEMGCLDQQGRKNPARAGGPSYPYWHNTTWYCLAYGGVGVVSICKEDAKWCNKVPDCHDASDENNCLGRVLIKKNDLWSF